MDGAPILIRTLAAARLLLLSLEEQRSSRLNDRLTADLRVLIAEVESQLGASLHEATPRDLPHRGEADELEGEAR